MQSRLAKVLTLRAKDAAPAVARPAAKIRISVSWRMSWGSAAVPKRMSAACKAKFAGQTVSW